MKTLPECDRCQYYAHSPHLVCSLHPAGPEAEVCRDFDPDPRVEPAGLTLAVAAGMYDGVIIRQPVARTREAQLYLLDTHPLFTNRCLNCGHEFTVAPLVHYDCPACGWVDDSIN